MDNMDQVDYKLFVVVNSVEGDKSIIYSYPCAILDKIELLTEKDQEGLV